MAIPALLTYTEVCCFLRQVPELLSPLMAAVKAVVYSGEIQAFLLFSFLWESSTIAGFFLLYGARLGEG